MFRSVFILVLITLSAAASAWWNDEWAGRKAFVLDTSATGANLTESLTDVPVLLRLHSGNFPAFFEVADGGRDFRFFSDDELTALKYHIESFDPINELAFVWVKVPDLAPNANAQKIWMYYGNPTAPVAADVPGSFDVAQTLVLHFDPDLGQPSDATAYANNPSTVSAQTVAASLVGAGARFDTASQIVVPASPSLAVSPESGWTFSLWLKPGQFDADALVMRKTDGVRALELRVAEGRLQAVYREGVAPEEGEVTGGEAGAGQAVVIDAGTLSTTGWQHLTMVASAERLTVFNNGELAGEGAAAIAPINGNLVIGADGEQLGFVGDVDEIQVANTARSPQWILAAQRIQGGDKLVVAQLEETQGSEGSSGGSSFFGTILSNVSIDGWVVIGLLVIMSALSWLVMVMKTMSLNRITADNRAFMGQFSELDPSRPDALDADDSDEDRELAGSPILQSLFGSHDHFQSSNIYHVYHTGMAEMNKRLGRSVGAQSFLSERELAAIRSAMDAATVRETQKLNSLMVMLTIAISGGPFLGLLGTVMGVMITFAAIAISGDVNIDAIAPGVSAALMTTVAGLFVAIPALFGYNYLAIRIRDMTADMYVFVDELEARIGEFHT